MKTIPQIPLFILALSLLTGILIAPFLHFDSFPLLLGGMGCTCILFASKMLKGLLWKERITVSLLIIMMGLLGHQFVSQQAQQTRYTLESLNCHEVVLAAVIDKAVKKTSYGRSTEMKLIAYCDSAKRWQSIAGRMQLYLNVQDSTALARYDSISLRAYITQIQTSSASYRQWLNSQGLAYKAYAKHIEILGQETSVSATSYRFQQQIGDRLHTLFGSGSHTAIAKALLLGDKTALSKTQKTSFATAGLSHILAISGLHVGIIFLLLNLLLRPLQLLPYGQQIKHIVILCLLTLYMLLAGASPAVVRATLMFGAVLIYKLLRRRYHFLNILGLSALIQMIIDPTIIQAIGFQLSYLAVLGIIGLFPLFEKAFNSPWSWVNHAFGWIGISLTATFFTTPLVIYYFGQFPTYFILSNVLVAVLAFVLVFLGFLLVLCAYIPLLSEALAWLTERCISLLIYIAEWVTALPGAKLDDFSWENPAWGYLAIELAVTLGILLLPKIIIKLNSRKEVVLQLR